MAVRSVLKEGINARNAIRATFVRVHQTCVIPARLGVMLLILVQRAFIAILTFAQSVLRVVGAAPALIYAHSAVMVMAALATKTALDAQRAIQSATKT